MSVFRKFAAELHRRSLWQVFSVYLVGSWVVYQVVVSVYEGVGLPDWVPPTALVLLLLGLPLVLTTAFFQEGGPGAGRDPDRRGVEPGEAVEVDGAAPAVSRANRRGGDPGAGRGAFFTWNRAVTAGVLAFAGLGLAASGFMGMRALGIGPAATLVSSGAMDAREPVILARFGSASGDTVLAAAVTEALRVDLEQSPVVTLAQTSFVQDALRRMRRDPATQITPDVAREVAIREGINAVLEGDITSVGSQHVLTARLVTTDGRTLASVRETAAVDGIIDAADRLSSALRGRVGESFKSIRATEPLARVTTPSLDALRKYSQGVRAFDSEPDPRKAIVLLTESLEHDSAFAMAWRKLGVAYQTVDMDSMRHAGERAYHFRDRLTERERYLTEGTYFSLVTEDTARAILAYEALLDVFPDDPTALHNLARQYSLQGDWERAAELYARKIEVDPYPAGTYRNQITVLATLKRYDEARAAVDAYEALYEDHPQAPAGRASLLAIAGDYAAAEAEFRRAIEMDGGPETRWPLAAVLLIQGRRAAALEEWKAIPGAGPEALARFNREFIHVSTSWLNGLPTPPDPISHLERQLGPGGLDDVPVEARPYFELAILSRLIGEIGRSEAFVARWKRDRPADWEDLSYQARTIEAEIAAARGDFDAAMALYRSESEDGCLDCWFHRGRIFDEVGMPDSARVAYETYLDPPVQRLYRVGSDMILLAPALTRLAEIHEEAGRDREAAGYYARLVELWRDADPELGPRVAAFQRALERLTAEGG